jgi:hypothetical protein
MKLKSFTALVSSIGLVCGSFATQDAMCQITDFRGTVHSQTLEAAFTAGRHTWLEWKPDLGVSDWLVLTNTIVNPDSASVFWSSSATWTISPSLGSQAFFRVVGGLNPPAP